MRKRIELRYDEPGNPETPLDEIVARDVDFIHFEAMSDTAIWCCIDVAGKSYHVWFRSKNGRSHIDYKVTAIERSTFPFKSQRRPPKQVKTRSMRAKDGTQGIY